MGCGASTGTPSEGSLQKEGANNNDQHQNRNPERQPSDLDNPKKKSKRDNRVSPGGNQANKENSIIQSSPPKPVPKSIAFDIVLDNKVDGIIGKHPPKRLQRLEPIDGLPRMSAEMLAEKQRLADEKRQRQLEKKKKKAARKATSRRHKQLLAAKQFEQQQQLAEEADEKQKLAEKNKEAKQRELEEKKRLREERAQKVRERARRLKQEGDDIDMDIEKDEHYNDDDVDSWLGENATSDYQSDLGDRVYSGHESPVKKPHKRTGVEIRPKGSAFSTSTTDSFDYAFQRTPATTTYHNDSKKDDFFDDDPNKGSDL